MDQHPLTVDRRDLQTHDLADPEAGRIGSRQGDTIAEACNRVQKADDLLGAQNRWQLLRLSAEDDPLERFLLLKRDPVEKAQRASDLIDMRPGILLGNEMQLIGADILHAETIRRTIEIATKLRHRINVRLLRHRREIADRHIFDHALAKKPRLGHLELPS